MKKSIGTEYEDICAICGKPKECTHHLCFGPDRAKADEDCLTIPLCHKHHNVGIASNKIHENTAAEALSKMVGQLAWEKDYYRRKLPETDTDEAREAFRSRYGHSFL